MTINKIVLYNFGPFSGKHSIDLSPLDRERNVVLVGGLNGSGKTSLLNSLQLGLFGKRAIKKIKGSGSYKSIINESFNSNSKDQNTYIEIHFNSKYQNAFKDFILYRGWRKTKTGFTEDFSISIGKDGEIHNKKLSENWIDHVDQFFPFNISDLFLFDGEKIEQIASYDNSNEYIKDSIKSLFGLDVIDSILLDLKILKKRYYDEIDGLLNDPNYHSALSELKNKEKELDSKISEKEGLKSNLENIKNLIEIQRQNLKAVGGDLYNNKESLEDTRKMNEDEKNELINDIINLMNNRLPFLFVDSLLSDIIEDGLNNYSPNEINLLEEKLFEQQENILDILKKSGTAEDLLSVIKNKLNENNTNNRFPEHKIITDRNVTYEARKLCDSLFDTKEVFDTKSKFFKDKYEDILIINKQLDNMPSSEKIKPQLDKLNHLIEKEKVLTISEEYVECQIESLKNMCGRINDNVLLMASDSNTGGESSLLLKQRIVKKIESIKPIITSFEKEMIKRRIKKIETLTLESTKKLFRKKGFINDFSIDPESFELKIINDLNEVINLDRLSAGERQILATSLLWGMAKAANQMLPLVIDTPLGRLDSIHRNNLIKYYFPEGSHQVILLSTDQEISGSYYEELKPFISKEYSIKYNSEKKSSEIIEGYPFKEKISEIA